MKNPLIKYARLLRKNSTKEERILWYNLQSRNFLGHKFRRQEPIENYIVDFICYEKKIIIELDGSQHAQDKGIIEDIVRDKLLNENGVKVMRFWNNEITSNLKGVLLKIKEELGKPSP